MAKCLLEKKNKLQIYFFEGEIEKKVCVEVPFDKKFSLWRNEKLLVPKFFLSAFFWRLDLNYYGLFSWQMFLKKKNINQTSSKY